MTDRAEIERLLNQTGRTLKWLPEDYGDKKLELWNSFRDKTFGHVKSFDMANRILQQSDVIELLVGALRDALAKVPKWISVEERLPEEGERVLCTDGHCVFEQYRVPLSCVYGTWDRGGLKSPMQNVTHWMPLPEPPEEGER